MSTAVVLLGAILVVAAAAFSLWLDRKNGKSSCGGNCGHCSACGVCHHATAKKKGELLRKLLAKESRKTV